MFTILDPKKTTRLFLVRHGWLSPEYELTDNTFCFGRMAYSGISRRKASVAIAAGNYIFLSDGPFSRSVSIINQSGECIGKAVREWFSHTAVLTMQTGFIAEFRRPRFWSREHVWNNNGYGRILTIKSTFFGCRDIVLPEQTKAPEPLVTLMILMGEHLIILRRRRRRAAH